MDTLLPLAPLSALSSQQTRDHEAIEKRAQEFEALMIAEFLKPMFDSVSTPSLFGGEGAEQSIFGGMMQEQYANAIAERGGIGIADQVKAALIELQSASTQEQEIRP
ncbi:MAG: rod-binding protein [Pseudomonadota bacterium]